MAGDWIKIETVTPDKPEVFTMADALGIDPDAVVGKLIRVWIWADQQTRDGNAPSVTLSLLNRISGVSGFADSMITVGWLRKTEAGIEFHNFERHNGETAKTRAMTAKRVQKHRADKTEEVKRKRNGDSVTEALPEKRREEKKEKERSGGRMDLQFPTHLSTPEALAAAEQWFDYLDRTGLDARSPRGDEVSLKHWWQNVGDDFVDSDSMVRAVSFSIGGNYLNLNAKRGTGKRVAEASSEDWLKVRKVIQAFPGRSESDTLKRREHLTKQQQEAVKRTGRENISTMTQFNETRIREVFENHLKDITNGK
jgi:hypothetical protein